MLGRSPRNGLVCLAAITLFASACAGETPDTDGSLDMSSMWLPGVLGFR